MPWDPIAPPIPDLILPVPVDTTGRQGPTRGESQGPGWRRSSSKLYVPASVKIDVVEQRILEAYAGAGPRGVVTGWASLRLQGGGHFDGLERDGHTLRPVPIAADGGRVRPAVGRQVLRHVVPSDEIVVIGGIRCAKVERALFDEMRLQQLEPREMAVVADSAFAARLTSLRRMRLYVATRRWYRDKRIVSAGLEMAREGSQSPQETRFRLVWTDDAGWDDPVLNRDVFDERGLFAGRPDLLCRKRGVAGQFAGGDHRTREQHQYDVGRLAALRRVGLEVVEVVGRDLGHRPAIIARMREAESRAALVPQTWVLGPPPRSLDAILDERDRRSAA
jgi:hypothetical protein